VVAPCSSHHRPKIILKTLWSPPLKSPLDKKMLEKMGRGRNPDYLAQSSQSINRFIIILMLSSYSTVIQALHIINTSHWPVLSNDLIHWEA
jgi:hypothetical protein